MVSDLARQSDDNSLTTEDYDYKTTPRRSSLNDDHSDSSKNGRQISLVSGTSATSKTSDQLQQSSSHTAFSTRSTSLYEKRQSVGENAPFGFSTSSSSEAASQDFSRKRDRFKMLLDDVLVKVIDSAVATSVSSSSSRQRLHQHPHQSLSRDENVSKSLHATERVFNKTKSLANGNSRILHKLVQEKQTETLLLQQKIDFQDSEITQLRAIIGNLHEIKKQQTSNVSHLRIALKRASRNATLARDEANKAEATASNLTTRVDVFDSVVQETKRASMLLLQEQEEIGAGMEGIEKEFVKVQTELARCSATKKKMQQEQRNLSQQLQYINDRTNEVQCNLDLEKSESLQVKRKNKELEISVQIQHSRSKRLQEDLDSTQVILIDSTSAAAESKHALAESKHALDRMEEANRYLHKQLQKHQTALTKQEASHQDELSRTKKDYQNTQMQLNNQKDRFRTLKMEKLATEKRQESQTAKIFALERRLKESTNLMTTTVGIPFDSTNGSVEKEGGDTRDFEYSNRKQSSRLDSAFVIPRLDGKENQRMSYTTKRCSICSKPPSGLMKKCECGRKGCKIRAHATCVQHEFIGISRPNLTSHAYLPVVLCCLSPSNKHILAPASDKLSKPGP